MDAVAPLKTALLRLHGRPSRLLRRWLAAALLLTGGALLLRPTPARGAPATATVVSARDLPAGTVLHAPDVKLVDLPDAVRPQGSTGAVEAFEGRLLAGAARAGEPLTDVRLVGPGIPGPGDPGTATLPVRLADPGVADLLRPGQRVDVVAAGEAGHGKSVLASMAVVVTAKRPDPGGRAGPGGPDKGPLVLLALPTDVAAQVAATSLERPVTVTLR
ncbi:SAF domain-containing protein [Amycolatopsis sp. H20-H5]|uniref:SAF domain-containing protein n=1 Tax=Amycolatopsis sp. H20-H5 TaxID=3046309 RepID=UPI002DB8F285|nr:SAF domain-containing protein [Amycolatopsis sp. H20-H5]MEC3978709.1 SAF domain-containing protein [Amycolatopsis sp. H20-H5]